MLEITITRSGTGELSPISLSDIGRLNAYKSRGITDDINTFWAFSASKCLQTLSIIQNICNLVSIIIY